MTPFPISRAVLAAAGVALGLAARAQPPAAVEPLAIRFTAANARLALAEAADMQDLFDPTPATVLSICDRVLDQQGVDPALRCKAFRFKGEASALLLRLGDARAAYREAIKLGCTDAAAIALVDAADRPTAGLSDAALAGRLRTQIQRAGPDKSAAGAYGELAKLAEAGGRAKEADGHLGTGRALDPANWLLLDCECAILTDRGRHAEVIAAVDQFVERRPDSPHAPQLLARKAEALRAAGRDRDAIRVALAADKMCVWPGQAGTRVDTGVTLSLAYLALGKPATALYAVERSLNLYEAHAPAHDARAIALARLGHTVEAERSIRRAAALRGALPAAKGP